MLAGKWTQKGSRAWRLGVRRLAGLSWPMLGLACVAAPLAVPLLALGGALAGPGMALTAARRKLARRHPAPHEVSVATRIGGRRQRMVSDDSYVFSVEGEFEPDLSALFATLVRPTDTVLDVGANIGCTAILLAGMARRVFAFEPSPSTYGYLQRNLAAARLTNVSLVNAGLGRAAARLELTAAPDNRSGGFVSDQIRVSDGHRVEPVAIMQGDAFLAEHRVHGVGFIKIDVEGFERAVLEGLSATLQRDRPVVVLELNHWCLNAFQRSSVPDFLDFLRSVFPLLYAVEGRDVRDLHDHNAAYHVTYHHIVRGLRYQNLVGAFRREDLTRFYAAYGLA